MKDDKLWIEIPKILSRISKPWEWVLHVVWRGWVQQIWVEFTVCRCKSIVLVGLAAIISAKGRASRMTLPHMEEVLIRTAWGVTTILTHKDFGASLTVGVLLVDAMDLPHVRLQRTSLCEGFLTELALVWADACGNRDNGFQTLELINTAQTTNNQEANQSIKTYLWMIFVIGSRSHSALQCHIYRSATFVIKLLKLFELSIAD